MPRLTAQRIDTQPKVTDNIPPVPKAIIVDSASNSSRLHPAAARLQKNMQRRAKDYSKNTLPPHSFASESQEIEQGNTSQESNRRQKKKKEKLPKDGIAGSRCGTPAPEKTIISSTCLSGQFRAGNSSF